MTTPYVRNSPATPARREALLLRAFTALPAAALDRLNGGRHQIARRRLEPALRFVELQARKRGRPLGPQTDVHKLRAEVAKGMKLMDGRRRPLDWVAERTVEVGEPGPPRHLLCRIYRPRGASAKPPLLVYFHQGGCVIGDLETADTFCSVLADEAKVVVLNVDYRLAPEHPYPAAVEDALAIYRWARDHAGELGADRERVAIGGDSAGGYLSAVVCQELRRTGERQPAHQLLVYPWVAGDDHFPSRDLYGDSHPLTRELAEWFADKYLPDRSVLAQPWANPLRERDLRGLAPATIATAGFDPLVDEGEAYARALRYANVDARYRCFDSLPHAFTTMSGISRGARWALKEIARNVAGRLHDPLWR
jgi:acetyl esterase/lipase